MGRGRSARAATPTRNASMASALTRARRRRTAPAKWSVAVGRAWIRTAIRTTVGSAPRAVAGSLARRAGARKTPAGVASRLALRGAVLDRRRQRYQQLRRLRQRLHQRQPLPPRSVRRVTARGTCGWETTRVRSASQWEGGVLGDHNVTRVPEIDGVAQLAAGYDFTYWKTVTSWPGVGPPWTANDTRRRS